MDLHKVAGVANAADLATKHLGPGNAKDHLEAIGVSLEGGRAANAPTPNQSAELGRWRGSGSGSGGSGGGCGVEGSGGLLPVAESRAKFCQEHRGLRAIL